MGLVTGDHLKTYLTEEVKEDLSRFTKTVLLESSRADRLTFVRNNVGSEVKSSTKLFLAASRTQEAQHAAFMSVVLNAKDQEDEDKEGRDKEGRDQDEERDQDEDQKEDQNEDQKEDQKEDQDEDQKEDKVCSTRAEHDCTKDDLFLLFVPAFFAGLVELKDEALAEVRNHQATEPHHPEYEKWNPGKECTDEDIEEMAFDRMSRNLQFLNARRVNMEVMRDFNPKFTANDKEKNELYWSFVDKNVAKVEGCWGEMFF